MKVFPGKEIGENPLVFIHVGRWYSGNEQTWHDTFILQQESGEWKDVTKSALPAGVDRASYFDLTADTPDVPVAAYVERTGRMLYPYGPCKLLLRWNWTTLQQGRRQAALHRSELPILIG